MVKTVYAKVKKQSVNARGTDNYLAHSVQRLYNKSAPMLLLESILFIVVGILMLINPLGILSAITFVLGCVLILIGFYRTVSGFVVSHEYGGGWFDVLSGLVNVIIGVLFLVYPLGSVISLVYVFVFLFIFKALRALVFAISMAMARFGHYIFNLIMALAFVALSVMLLFYPVVGVATVVVYIAIMLLMYAFANLYMFFELRRLKAHVSD